MKHLEIGIITIGVGLLSLIYPLTHIYLINLLRDLHSAWEVVVKKEKQSIYQSDYNAINSYHDTVRYILNVFFLSGLLFVVIFIFLMRQREEEWVSCCTIVLISVFILLAMGLTIYLFFKEGMKGCLWMSLVVTGATIIFYIIVLISLFGKCLSQSYIILLWLGLLMVFQVFWWFWAGIKFGPLSALTNIRRT
jgi:heme/copper-type cytochrome/quinol oxidase subunit 4